jgi:hypothetical protein
VPPLPRPAKFHRSLDVTLGGAYVAGGFFLPVRALARISHKRIADAVTIDRKSVGKAVFSWHNCVIET